jgi:hypothetical protein
MCDRPATTSEHVPPKCFFPGPKELPHGLILRKNLITVPSCEIHNLHKSDDDQYLLAILISHLEGNAPGKRNLWRKVLAGLQKKPHLYRTFFKNLRPVRVGTLKTGIYEVDRRRFERGVSSMARALYYHLFRERWSPEIKVLTPALLMIGIADAERYNREMKELDAQIERTLNTYPRRGDNPSIFHYKIHRNLPAVQLIVRLVFYGGVKVTAISDPLAM